MIGRALNDSFPPRPKQLSGFVKGTESSVCYRDRKSQPVRMPRPEMHFRMSGRSLAAVLVPRACVRTTRHERTSLCRYFGEWTLGRREYVRSMNHSVHRDVDAARWREGDEARAPSSMPKQIGKGDRGGGRVPFA